MMTTGRSSAATCEQPPVTPPASARVAGLRYVCDDGPGIRRIRCGQGFRYLSPDSKPIHDEETLQRIRSLAIPPAWTKVWICSLANGHLQATGRDARARKQYRYHPHWRKVRDENKFDRLVAFALALPRIRARIQTDLALPGLPRNKVLATVVRLLESTLIRVGNEEYVRANGSFGLTTLRDRHARVDGSTVHFTFRGKSGIRHRIDVHDPRLARIVRRCRDLPGQILFQYLDDQGTIHAVDSVDVNTYLREITEEDFTARDFRTWAGTVLTAQALLECADFGSQTQAKRNVVAAIETVAKRLRNTPSVCRKCYVHPGVITGYLDGSLAGVLQGSGERETGGDRHELSPEESAVLAFLKRQSEDRPTS
jgi:DNA topoisomerase-1